jgi:SAM-dependent methyltransferase
MTTPRGTDSVPNFDRLARPYRWLEYLSFGTFLHRARTHFLPKLDNFRNALVLGDGDGRFTSALLSTNPRIHVHAIDISPRMLESLRRAAQPHEDRVITEVADLRRWQPQSRTRAPYDLIATHFVLDCLTSDEIAILVRRLRPCLAGNAVWIVSDFAVPNTAFGQWIAQPLVAALYFAFGLLTGLETRHLPNHGVALTRAGWSLEIHRPYLNGLLISQLWTLDDVLSEP